MLILGRKNRSITYYALWAWPNLGRNREGPSGCGSLDAPRSEGRCCRRARSNGALTSPCKAAGSDPGWRWRFSGSAAGSRAGPCSRGCTRARSVCSRRRRRRRRSRSWGRLLHPKNWAESEGLRKPSCDLPFYLKKKES